MTTPLKATTDARTTAFAVAGRTHVGNVRKQNEDSYLVDTELSLFVVADGMGGHAAGEVASEMASTSMRAQFRSSPSDGPPSSTLERGEPRRLVLAVEHANSTVHLAARKNRKAHGMGTTVVAAHVVPEGDRIHIAHVGDSRCYRLRSGVLEQLTRDHSVYNDVLLANPTLKPEHLGAIPRNVISRALGLSPTVKVDARSEAVVPGDAYILCSDGLSAMIDDDAITQAMKLSRSPEEACDLLVTLANEAGGKDNVTVIVVHFP